MEKRVLTQSETNVFIYTKQIHLPTHLQNAKLAILAFFHYEDVKMEVDTVVSHINFDSKYHFKCKFLSIFIQLVTIVGVFKWGRCEDILK